MIVAPSSLVEHISSGSLPNYVHRFKQRRFWEHPIQDEDELIAYFDDVHYNPVKHRLVTCPHLWSESSFHSNVIQGVYDQHWGCQCGDRRSRKFDF